MVNKPSKNAIDLIKKFEGFYAKAYLDPVLIPTIGWGTIRYKNGKKVKVGDVIRADRAEEELMYEVNKKANEITGINVNQNQFDAIVSFVYNLGIGAFNKSTLKKKIIKDPQDPTIEAEFNKWVNAGGKPLKGLIKRRAAEWSLYNSLVS